MRKMANSKGEWWEHPPIFFSLKKKIYLRMYVNICMYINVYMYMHVQRESIFNICVCVYTHTCRYIHGEREVEERGNLPCVPMVVFFKIIFIGILLIYSISLCCTA